MLIAGNAMDLNTLQQHALLVMEEKVANVLLIEIVVHVKEPDTLKNWQDMLMAKRSIKI